MAIAKLWSELLTTKMTKYLSAHRIVVPLYIFLVSLC